MPHGRWPPSILFSVGLLALVGVLAWLQYRWLGEVSEAERARLQTSLKERAGEFADDFDREITRAYLTFQVDEGALTADASAFAARYDTWLKDARAPQLVRSVYVARSGAPDAVQQYQPASRTFVSTPWPEDLAAIRQRLTQTQTVTAAGAGTITMLRTPIVASVPALVLSAPFVEAAGGDPLRTFIRRQSGSTVIVVFDRQYLETAFLPSLVKRYFPEDGADAYRFAVIDTTHPSQAVYSRGVPAGAGINPQQADATTRLFAFRFELLDQTMGRIPATAIFSSGSVSIAATHNAREVPPAPKAEGGNRQYKIIVEQRTAETGLRGSPSPAGEVTKRVTDVLVPSLRTLTPGVWQLVLQHQAGSLEAAVAQARRRNLTLSFGILALLCVSVGLIVVNAQRSQRLAGQQMDFVATVSHELRTPLAVIRSAAQNLSAGVVHEPAQARRYGELIENEGRRLTDMIEQVLDYAGLSGHRRPRLLSAVDVAAVVDDLVTSSRGFFEAGQIEVTVSIDPDLPFVMADEGAIRRALQNLVTNALKYGADGRWIGIEVKRLGGGSDTDPGEVRVTVSDRGPGIDAADLAHVFEPFYRGARARDRQVHGSGLGLSLVKRIVEAHGGRVTVASAAGQGAAFTVTLPASAGLTEPTDVETPHLLPQAPARP